MTKGDMEKELEKLMRLHKKRNMLSTEQSGTMRSIKFLGTKVNPATSVNPGKPR